LWQRETVQFEVCAEYVCGRERERKSERAQVGVSVVCGCGIERECMLE